MGKASRFLKALFGLKSPGSDVDKQAKRRWSFFKSQRDKPQHVSDARLQNTPLHYGSCDQKFRADGSSNGMVEVSAGEGGHWFLWEWAAVRIQTYFRAFLARKALRALKSLVRLQALVRGHIQRKQAADLRRYKALVRDQVRARACRFQVSDSPQSATKGPPTPEKFEHVHRSRFTRHNQPSMLKNNGSTLYDERTGKILEMDPTKPHIRRRKLFQPDQISHSQSLSTSRGSTIDPYGLSPYGPGDITSLTSLTGPFKYFTHEEQLSYTAQNSPPFYANSSKNASMRVSPFTPAKSDSSRSCQSGYSDHPNYMAYTESSWAKVRSVSAPRHRPNFELTSITKRYSVYGYGSGTGTGTQRGSNVRDSFVSKAYPGSGRLDRLGMPVGGIAYRESEYSGGYWN